MKTERNLARNVFNRLREKLIKRLEVKDKIACVSFMPLLLHSSLMRQFSELNMDTTETCVFQKH